MMVDLSFRHRCHRHSPARCSRALTMLRVLAKVVIPGSPARIRQTVRRTNRWQPLLPLLPLPLRTSSHVNGLNSLNFFKGKVWRMTLLWPADLSRKKPHAAALNPPRRPTAKPRPATSGLATPSWRQHKTWRIIAKSLASARRREQCASWRTWRRIAGRTSGRAKQDSGSAAQSSWHLSGRRRWPTG